MTAGQFARCPECNAKVRINSRRWDTKLNGYVLQPSYGLHPPHNNSYDPSRCEMSNKVFKGELITA